MISCPVTLRDVTSHTHRRTLATIIKETAIATTLMAIVSPADFSYNTVQSLQFSIVNLFSRWTRCWLHHSVLTFPMLERSLVNWSGW